MHVGNKCDWGKRGFTELLSLCPITFYKYWNRLDSPATKNKIPTLYFSLLLNVKKAQLSTWGEKKLHVRNTHLDNYPPGWWWGQVTDYICHGWQKLQVFCVHVCFLHVHLYEKASERAKRTWQIAEPGRWCISVDSGSSAGVGFHAGEEARQTTLQTATHSAR